MQGGGGYYAGPGGGGPAGGGGGSSAGYMYPFPSTPSSASSAGPGSNAGNAGNAHTTGSGAPPIPRAPSPFNNNSSNASASASASAPPAIAAANVHAAASATPAGGGNVNGPPPPMMMMGGGGYYGSAGQQQPMQMQPRQMQMQMQMQPPTPSAHTHGPQYGHGHGQRPPSPAGIGMMYGQQQPMQQPMPHPQPPLPPTPAANTNTNYNNNNNNNNGNYYGGNGPPPRARAPSPFRPQPTAASASPAQQQQQQPLLVLERRLSTTSSAGSAAELFASAGPAAAITTAATAANNAPTCSTGTAVPQGPPTQTQTQINRVPSHASYASSQGSFDQHQPEHEHDQHDSAMGPGLTAAASLFSSGITSAASGAATLFGSAQKKVATATATATGNTTVTSSMGNVVQSVKSAGAAVASNVTERGVSGSILGMVEKAGMAPSPMPVAAQGGGGVANAPQGGAAAAVPAAAGQQGELLVEDLDESHDDDEDVDNDGNANDNGGGADGGGSHALQEGWEEIIDETSGQPYYYNSTTGETTWDRPVAVAMVADAPGAPAAVAAAPPAPAVVEVSESEPGPEAETEPAPQEEVAPVAPVAEVAAEIEPEPEPIAEPIAERAAAAVTDAAIGEERLQDGWEEITDEANGMPYYYNSITGETTWDRPVAPSAAAAQEPAYVNVEQTAAPEPEPVPVPVPVPAAAVAAAGGPPMAAPGIVAAPPSTAPTELEFPPPPASSSDVVAGEISSASQEVPTVTLLPAETVSEIVGGEATGTCMPESEPVETEMEGESPASVTALAPGWEELFDECSGQPYYYNSTTGETSWEKPVVEEAAAVEDVAPPPPPIATEEHIIPNQDTAAPSAAAEESAPPVVDVPAPAEEIAEVQQGPIEAEPEVAVTEDLPEPAPVAEPVMEPAALELPEAWQAFTDPGGQTYYYNQSTGETSWEKPAIVEAVPEQPGADIHAEAPPLEASVESAVEEPAPTTQAEPELAQVPEPEPVEPTMVPSTPAPAQQQLPAAAAFSAPPKQSVEVASTPSQVDQPGPAEHSRQVQSAARPPVSSTTARTRLNLPLPSKRTLNVPSRTPRQPGQGAAPSTGASSTRRRFRLPPPSIKSTPTPSQEENITTVPTPKEAIEPLPTKTPHNTPAVDVDYIEDSGEGPSLELPASSAPAPGASGTEAPAGAPTAPIPTPALPPRGPVLPSMTPAGAQPESTVEAAAAVLSQPFKIEKKLSFSSATAQEEHAQVGGGPDEVEEEEEDDIVAVDKSAQPPPPQEGTEALVAGVVASEIVDEAIDRVIDTAAATGEVEDNVGGTNIDVPEATEAVPTLPVGWQELTDPSSGQVYFYNSETGETSWDAPVVEEEATSPAVEESGGAADAQEQRPPQTEASEETVVSGSSWEVVNGDAEPKEAEIKPSADDGVQPPDNNSDDGWAAANPEAEGAAENAGEGAASSEPTAQSELPSGWIQVIDETSGDPYYFNEDTGESSWEKPPIDTDDSPAEPKSDDPVPEAAAAPTTTEETAPTTDEDAGIVGGDPQLPEGWSEQTTEDGERYYFNENTGESSWDRPLSIPGDDVGAVDASIPVSETEYESAPTSDDGWQTVKEVPVPEGAPDDAETESLRALSTKQDIGSSPPPSVSELDGMMPVAMSQNAGDVATNGEEENDEIVDEPEPEPEPATSQDTGELPPGWLECTDPEGNAYFFNDLTGESSWERPQGVTASDAPEHAETESAIDEAETESLRALSVKRDVGSSPPPSVSELDGMVEVPPTEGEELAAGTDPSVSAEADVGPEPDVPAEPAADEVPGEEEVAPLPEPWVELMTDAGEPYYYNQEYGTTSWERPLVPLESAVSAGDDTGAGGAAQEVLGATGNDTPAVVTPMDDTTPQGETQLEPVSESNEAEQPLQTLLPKGWTEETTDAGEVYYYNTETGETQWERPVSEDAAVEEHSQIEGAQSTDEFVHVEKEPEMSEDGAPSAAATTAGDSELPAPWEMLYTPEGEAYYFNPESGETSWEKPSAPSDPVDYRTSAASAAAAAASTSNAASSQVELRPRPAHAIASFGFGGRLSVMFPQQATSLMGGPTPAGGSSVGLRRGPVVVHTLKDILDASDAALSGDPSSTNDQFQPMITMHETEAYQRIEEKASSENNASLLWNLILIASKWNGRLRSINGPSDPNSPEAAIVQLLLDSDKKAKDQEPPYAMPSPMKVGAGGVDTSSAQQGEIAADLEDIQNHLIRGQREEAVARAVSSKNYALAFLVAAMCDRETYHAVAQKFVDDALQSGTPLHTCCSLFSGQMVPPDDMQLDRTGEKPSCFGDDSLNLAQTWKYQLAGILSNRTAGWEHIILALGDRLLQLGEVCPAHFCYMVCGCSITDPTHPMTRLSLVGCDHVIPEHIGLLTREGVESYERTEAFEWAKRRGNPNAAIPALQQFKLSYAKRLADHGLMREAKSHVDAIRHCTGLGVVGDERAEARKRRYYSEKFEEDLDIFEDRVCFVLGIPSSMEKRLEAEKLKKGAVSRALENMSSVFSKGLSKAAAADNDNKNNGGSDGVAVAGKQTEQRDESSVGGGADGPDSSFVSAMSMPTTAGAPPAASARGGAGIGMGGMAPIEEDTAQQTFEPPQPQQQQQPLLSPGTASNNRPDDDMSFVSATSNVLDTTGATFKSAHPHPTTAITGEAEGAPPPMMNADPFAAAASLSASASAPPPATLAASPFGHQPAGGFPVPTKGGFPVPTKEPAPASEQPMPVASTPAPKTAPAGPLPDASSGMAAEATNKPPKSDPVVLDKPTGTDKASETPSSKSGWSLRNFIAKKLNPDATVATLEDSGKMVYSEEYKCWYVEGVENPAELAKARAPPPPPTLSMPTPSTPAAPAGDSNPSDPLAALMAPAGLRVPSRSTPAGMGRPPSGMPGMPPTAGPPPMNMMMGATPIAKNTFEGGAAAAMPPPTFSVFTPGPTPAKAENEKREEDGN